MRYGTSIVWKIYFHRWTASIKTKVSFFPMKSIVQAMLLEILLFFSD